MFGFVKNASRFLHFLDNTWDLSRSSAKHLTGKKNSIIIRKILILVVLIHNWVIVIWDIPKKSGIQLVVIRSCNPKAHLDMYRCDHRVLRMCLLSGRLRLINAAIIIATWVGMQRNIADFNDIRSRSPLRCGCRYLLNVLFRYFFDTSISVTVLYGCVCAWPEHINEHCWSLFKYFPTAQCGKNWNVAKVFNWLNI